MRRLTRGRALASVLVTLLAALSHAVAAADPALIEAGRRLYLEGVSPAGAALRAQGVGGTVAEGREVACVNCHRHSGMGMGEGINQAPPVAGPVLFTAVSPPTGGRQPRVAPGFQRTLRHWELRPAYDRATLGRALREGLSPAGATFDALMPRYQLADADLAALEAYLRVLGSEPEPGVAGNVLHFATLVAEDADPVQARAMLDVLDHCAADTRPPSRPAGSRSPEWHLHVWRLPADRADWPAALRAHYARRPVLAVLSGIGAGSWAPVHAFCERTGVPCLFPLVDSPPAQAPGHFSFYLSEGARLQGRVLAAHLLESGTPGRVVQVADAAGPAADAAKALRDGLQGSGWQVVDRPVGGDGGIAALRDSGAADVLVLWLKEAQVAALVRARPAPPAVRAVYLSGTLAGLDAAPLSPAWRAAVAVVYPFETLDRRLGRMMINAGTWLDAHGIAITRQTLHTLGNTYSACEVTRRAVLALRERYSREYLIEQVENAAAGAVATPFLRFTLGPGQRFGSKGAYITRFADPNKPLLKRDTDWIVP